jgi:hypothetical protein
MTRRTRLATLLGVAALSLALSGAAWANGSEFFEADNDGQVFLYYFGNVKDTAGKPVDKFYVNITVKNVEIGNKPLEFRFRNDAPGHFRTTDIGRAIKGLGKPVDPNYIDVTIRQEGYRVVKAPKVPDKQRAVELDGFVLEKVPGPAK